MSQDTTTSLAIETSCRMGGVAVGRGDTLLEELPFEASRRHATQLVSRLDELLSRHTLKAADIDEVYVSAGPGGFTGLRLGITVARTLAQVVNGLRCVSVPSPLATAVGLRDAIWQNLGVILDAGEGMAHATFFGRDEISAEALTVSNCKTGGAPFEGRTLTPQEVLEQAPRPVLLAGEGLDFLGRDKFAGQGISLLEAQDARNYPSAGAVWQTGRFMAKAGQFTEAAKLLPIYSRPPEAVRLWEKRNGT